MWYTILMVFISLYLIQFGIMVFKHGVNGSYGSRKPTGVWDVIKMTFYPYAIKHMDEYRIPERKKHLK